MDMWLTEDACKIRLVDAHIPQPRPVVEPAYSLVSACEEGVASIPQ